MTLHCFTIPALQPEPAQSELNAFLAQARVVAVHRHFVADGAASFWALCIDVASGPGRLPDALRAAGARAAQPGAAPASASASTVDYKQVLSPADFAVFAGLRELRKTIAQREGVPVYAVFTNEQLASMVQQRVASKAGLGAVDGVGAARVARYGDEFAAWLAARWAADPVSTAASAAPAAPTPTPSPASVAPTQPGAGDALRARAAQSSPASASPATPSSPPSPPMSSPSSPSSPSPPPPSARPWPPARGGGGVR
jgi:hypothetical protein